jgi:hypothetical protein
LFFGSTKVELVIWLDVGNPLKQLFPSLTAYNGMLIDSPALDVARIFLSPESHVFRSFCSPARNFFYLCIIISCFAILLQSSLASRQLQINLK